MPRRRRLQLAEVPLRIFLRGIDREPCFFTEEDYHCDFHWQEGAARDCGCAIHADSRMSNHVYPLLTSTVSGSPARLMQALGRRYVEYSAASHGTLAVLTSVARILNARLMRVSALRIAA